MNPKLILESDRNQLLWGHLRSWLAVMGARGHCGRTGCRAHEGHEGALGSHSRTQLVWQGRESSGR